MVFMNLSRGNHW